MKKTAATLALVTVLPAALVLGAAPRRAHACGGCFAPTDTVTTVEAHRMVIALSAEETVLWDQIRYSGNPRDFVWVLPAPTPDVQIEIADPAFFDEIDSQTAPRIQPAAPLQPCASGCGSSAGGGGGTDDVDEPVMPTEDVTVYAEETVGPYETVVIGSEDADALRTWLTERGYRIGAETEPVLDHYIDQESVFVVLRLAPGQGINAMQPVRVHYPGYMASFPLKMVTVGATGVLELSLWVIAEQRYGSLNYPIRAINPSDLVWDWNANRSNYTELFDDTIANTGGRAWIVEHATPMNELWISSPERNVITELQPAPYITRLRTRMLVDHLSDDLQLSPAFDWARIDNFLVAQREVNRPTGNCDALFDPEYGCSGAAGARLGQVLIPMLLVLGGLLWRRRRLTPR
jgi:hypothetical protein